MSAKMKKYAPVTIRYKRLANGNRSIYLDYQLKDGTRKLEYLKMYLLPGRSADCKRLNTHTLRAVAYIQAQRLMNLARDKEADAGVEAQKRLLLEVIDEYARLRVQRGARGAKRYYGTAERYVRLFHPHIRMREVNLDFVTELADYLMQVARTRAGKPLAKATIRGVLTALGAVLRYAQRKEMMGANPVDLYDTRRVDGPAYPRVYLMADELRALARTPCSHTAYKELFLFACLVGLRFSDLVTLKWKDVIEEAGTVRIEKMMHKTGHMVYVPLSKAALNYLPARGDFDRYVFGDEIPRRVGPINRVIKQWAEAAGIEKHLTFYTARHTFATLTLTQGADLYAVSRLLGHKRLTTTEGYARIIDPKKEEAMYQLDALFADYLEAQVPSGGEMPRK